MRWVHRLCFASASLLVAACWLLFVGCSPGSVREVAPPPKQEKANGSKSTDSGADKPARRANDKDVAALVKGNTAFALELYRELVKRKPAEGLAFSPYSVSESLALLSIGTKGKTHKELASALGLGLEGEKLAAAFATLDAQIVPGSVTLRAPGVGLCVADEEGKGVKIDKVVPRSPAAVAGLSPGNIIVAVGGEPVRNVNDYIDALDRAGPVVVIETRFGENSSLSYRVRRPKQPSPSAERSYNLSVANAVWAQKGVKFNPQFIRTARNSFGAAIEELDFADKPENSRKTINKWIERRTEGVVKEMLAPKTLSKDTVLTLTNAIAFSGLWKQPFDKEKTEKGTFTTLRGTRKQTPMMSELMDGKLFQNTTEGVRVLELGYQGGDVVIDFILPVEPDGLPQVEKKLPKSLALWLNSLKERESIAVTLPRFTIGGKVNLAPVLKKMGVELVFTSGEADFSGLSARKDLAVSRVSHAAEVRVDEKGTSAVGATATEIIGKGKKFSFKADHPFLFVLRDPKTKTILFMGRVTDPTASKG